jgi:hypothetical protein
VNLPSVTSLYAALSCSSRWGSEYSRAGWVGGWLEASELWVLQT